MALFLFYLFLFGGFLLAAATGISYFRCRALPHRRRVLLGLLSLSPLLSILLFLLGHPTSRQAIVILPCLAGGIAFLITLLRGAPSAFSIAPRRAFTAGAGILWAGATTFLASDPGFMGANC